MESEVDFDQIKSLKNHLHWLKNWISIINETNLQIVLDYSLSFSP